MKFTKLNLTADRIETVLRDGRAPARVVGGKVLPNFVEMFLVPEPGTKVNQIKSLLADIGLAVGNSNVRLSQTGNHLALQISKNSREPVYLDNLLKQVPASAKYTAVMGISEDGSPLMAKVTSPEVSHVLISGATGSGKTSLAHSMILSLCNRHRPHQFGLVILDPKRRQANIFDQNVARHLLMPIAHSTEEISSTLARLCDLMDEQIIQADPEPRIVIFVDELGDMCQTGGSEVIDKLARIAVRGREHGLHLIACTQKPSTKSIGPLLKSNLPLRLVGKMTSADDARLAAGRAGSGAEKFNGDFVAVTADRIIRFQAAMPNFS
jgi:S-DNA-T family DNA segregation ATPase FtsK/SpoIIIE